MLQLKNKVCAGIVLYNPEIPLLKRNIEAIVPQVSEVFLFDNASSNSHEIAELIKAYPNVVYNHNEKNEGIAYGLNDILKYATDKGYEWFLTLDQDSVCSPNLISEYSKFTSLEKCGLICPFILNNNKHTMESYQALGLPEYEIIQKPIDCITSACLGNVELVNKVGGFPDEYFIDYVDVDLNCRIMLAGYNIIRANRAYLLQNMGEARKIPVFSALYKLTKIDAFRRMQTASVYGDLRLYYSARNSRAVYKKYKNAGFRVSPLFMFMLFSYFTLTYPKDRNRIKMWKSIIKGFRDYKKIM